jgi:hypothetical protein
VLAAFWAIFSQTHQATLIATYKYKFFASQRVVFIKVSEFLKAMACIE